MWRFRLLYAALFLELGVNLPFFPVWLRAQSLGDAAIGLAVAVPFYVRLVANPLVSALADRSGRLDIALVACAVIVVAATAMLPAVEGLAAILLVITAIAFAQGPLIALTDALTLGHLARVPERLGRYGGIRLWGSGAFVLANLAAGVLLEWLPADAIAFFLLAAATGVAVAALALTRSWRRPEGASGAVPATPAVRPPGAEGATRRRLVLVIGGAALIQASHGLVYAFGALHWQTIGLSSAAIGGLWALGVLAEIGFFLLLARLMRAGVGAMALLLLGGVAASVRWLGMATDPAVALLVPLQMGHALSFGATHAGSVFLLTRLAPAERQAQAQGWLAALWAGLMAALLSLCGPMMQTFGQATYLVPAATAATGVGLVGLGALAARPDPRRAAAIRGRSTSGEMDAHPVEGACESETAGTN